MPLRQPIPILDGGLRVYRRLLQTVPSPNQLGSARDRSERNTLAWRLPGQRRQTITSALDINDVEISQPLHHLIKLGVRDVKMLRLNSSPDD